MNARLFAIFLSLFVVGHVAFADEGTTSSGGGDAYAQEFISTGRKIVAFIKKHESEKFEQIDIVRLEKAVEETRVVTLEEVFLKDVEVDAVNYPSEGKIELNRRRWQVIRGDFAQKAILVLHEYLGILRAADRNYLISSRVLDTYLDSSKNDGTLGGGIQENGEKPVVNWMVEDDTGVHSRGVSLVTDADGNVIVTGNIWNSHNQYDENAMKMFTAKYNASGNLLWRDIYENGQEEGDSIGLRVQVDTRGNIYSFGAKEYVDEISGFRGKSTRLILTKYGVNGEKIFAKNLMSCPGPQLSENRTDNSPFLGTLVIDKTDSSYVAESCVYYESDSEWGGQRSEDSLKLTPMETKSGL